MTTRRVICRFAVFLVLPLVASAQSTFEPLARWEAALRSGSESALAAFYSRVPPAQVQIDSSVVQDPEEEPRYWSAVMAKGPVSLKTKLLALQPRPQGMVEVVLRMEMTIPTNAGNQPYAAAVHLFWQREGNDWRIVGTRREDLEPNPKRRLSEPDSPKTNLYAPPEDGPAEVSAALAAASKDHKRVILVFGANWCYDCHVLDATFHSSAVAPLVNANYHVVHVNVGEDGNKNLDLAEKYGLPLKQALRLPSLAVVDSKGNVIYSQKLGEFDDTERFSTADVTAFLRKWAPPQASKAGANG